MRGVVMGAIGVVLGAMLGALPYAYQVQGRNEKIAELEQRDCIPSPFAGAVTQMIAPKPTIPKEDGEPDPFGLDEPAEVGGPGSPSSAPPLSTPGAAANAPDPAMVETVETAIAMRRAQARAALIEDVDPTDEQLAALDDAMETMSGELNVLAQDFVKHYQEKGEPSRRDMLVFAAEAMDVLIDAEDQMASILTEEQREMASPEAIDPLSWLDPSIAGTLSQLPDRGL